MEFLAKDLSCNQCGDILITNNTVCWKLIKRGDKIPENAIKSGKDNNNDLVWIGKSNDNEPGKINCENNDADIPTITILVSLNL